MASLILIVAMFALLWLLLIRPQRQKQAEQQRMIETVEPGDEVLTVGGLIGRVRSVQDEELVLEIAPGTEVRVARRSVASVLSPALEGRQIEAAQVSEQEEEVRS